MIGGKQGWLHMSHLTLNATNATMRHSIGAKDISNVNIELYPCPIFVKSPYI